MQFAPPTGVAIETEDGRVTLHREIGITRISVMRIGEGGQHTRMSADDLRVLRDWLVALELD